MASGGKREGSGRKKTLKSEIIQDLRGRITDEHFERAIAVLCYAMTQEKKSLKFALSAAMFVIEQKIGKAPQPVQKDEGLTEEEMKVLKEIAAREADL